ncbi:MAG: hydrogenase maturation nickel metallochaperone HypA [Armatimonadota bacterium]|nr:hydrogenase maturation nickel metallochaperone HypA [Armatimonadota bacterium]
MSYLLESVEEQARQLGARKVLAINLVLGERAGIDDSLLFYFDLLAPGTLAEGAKLNVRRTAMRFRCERCESDYSPVGADFGCPQCGTVGQLTDDGSELLIESMEIER